MTMTWKNLQDQDFYSNNNVTLITSASKIEIQVCNGFASLPFVIDQDQSHVSNQSAAILKPIATWSLVFSRLFKRVIWVLISFFFFIFSLIGRCFLLHQSLLSKYSIEILSMRLYVAWLESNNSSCLWISKTYFRWKSEVAELRPKVFYFLKGTDGEKLR